MSSSPKAAYETNPKAYWDAPRPKDEKIDSINARDPRGISLWLNHVLPEIEANKGHGICLDLGCGGGRYIPNAAARFEKVIGIDFSASNLETAKVSIDSLGIVNVDLYNSDLGDIKNIPDANVDFAYSMAVFMHMPNETKRRALKELCRVLKLEGIVVLIEIIPMIDGAFDCPDIKEKEWQDMITEVGLQTISIESADPFTKFKLSR